MLGLRLESDVNAVRSLAPTANSKSHKFATQLAGRFFVSGVSGGFQKHTKEKQPPIERNGGGSKLSQAQAIFLGRQAREIQDDANRLLQIEAQLREINQKKELRRHRDRDRRRKKVEYISACKIQRCVRYFFGTKLKNVADTIISFIRTQRARQALAIGAWAVTTVRRFALHVTRSFKERRRVRLAAEKKANEEWLRLQQLEEASALVRSETTNHFVVGCLRHGLIQAMGARIKALKSQKSPIAARRPAVKPSPSPAKQKKTLAPAHSPKGGDNVQFFLTEFDSGGGGDGEKKTSPDRHTPTKSSSITTIVNARHVPLTPASSLTLASNLISSQSTTALTTLPLFNETDLSALFGNEEVDEDLVRRNRIAGLHDERVARMQRERQLRLARLEQTKRAKEAEALELAREEAQEKAQREEAKRQWLSNYEAQRVANARAFAKSVAHKEKAAKAERSNERRELQQMGQEDKPSDGGKRRPAVPRLAPRPPRPSSPTPEELAKKREEEAALAALKRQQQEELMQRGAAALKERLARQKAKELQQKQLDTELEQKKILQRAKVAAEAQTTLLRALEMKQLALERNKNGGGSRGGGDESMQEDGSKKVVRGEGATRKKKSSKKKSNGLPIHARAHVLVDPSFHIGDLEPIPIASLAEIEEWNYGVLPADGGAAENAMGDDGNADDEAAFNFEEFMEHAIKPTIEKRPLTKSGTASHGESAQLLHAFEQSDSHEREQQQDEEDNDGDDNNSEIGSHHFADMLNDEASHYDWMADEFAEMNEATDLGEMEIEQDEAENESVEEHENGDLIDLIVDPTSQRPVGERSELVNKSESVGNAPIMHVRGINKQPVVGKKQLAPTCKSNKKVSSSSSVSGSSSSSIAASLGQSHYKGPVKIPAALKNTPYFAAYVKSKPSLPSAVPVAPTKQGHRKGKVAELLEMVAKARKKLGKPIQASTEKQQRNYDGPESDLSAPRLTLSPRFNAPPSLEFFLRGHKDASRVAASKKSKPANACSQDASRVEQLYDFDLHEVQRSLEAEERDVCASYPGEDGGDDDVEEEEADEQKERLLNAECDLLRRRLEERIGASASSGEQPAVHSDGVESSSHLNRGGVGLSAAVALSSLGGFENSLAAKLLAQWAQEDELGAQEFEHDRE